MPFMVAMFGSIKTDDLRWGTLVFSEIYILYLYVDKIIEYNTSKINFQVKGDC